MSKSIFISFSSKDIVMAEAIYDHLEGRGFRCWISSRDVLPGDNYQESIVRAIRASRLMLFIFSTNTNNSDEVKKELSLASKLKLNVIPLRVEDIEPNDALMFELATRQWVDFFDDWESAFERLVDQITRVLAAKGRDPAAGSQLTQQSATNPVPDASPSAGSGRSGGKRMLLAAAAGAFVLAAVVFWLLFRPVVETASDLPAPGSDAIGSPASTATISTQAYQTLGTNPPPVLGISGTWVGWHECLGARIGTTVKLSTNDRGQISGTEGFYPTKDDPNRKEGKLTIAGRFDGSARQFSFDTKDWIVRPQNYPSCGFVGAMDGDGKTLVGHTSGCPCGNFELRRK